MSLAAPTEDHATFSSRIENIALSVFLVAGVLLTFGCVYPVGTHGNEAVPIIKTLLNPTLYPSDLFVHETIHHFTPRTYTYCTIVALCQLGLSVGQAYFSLYVLAMAAHVLGLRAIARHLGKTGLTTALLIAWGLLVTGTELGMTRLLPNTPIPAVFAMGITIWGIYFAFRRRWILAFSIFGCACLLQFLVGLLPAMLCTPLMMVSLFRARRWKTALLALLLFGIGAAAVYLPMRLQGATSSSLLSDREFVFLYGQVVLPHHIVPSAWLRCDWLDAILFFLGGLLLSLRCRSHTGLRKLPFLIVGMVSLCLLTNYVFVEIWPWALIAKLQFGRTVPFAVLSILIALVVLFEEQYRAGRYLVCGYIAAAPLAPFGGLFLGLLALIWRPLEDFQKKLTPRDSIILGLIIFSVLFASSPSVKRSLPIELAWVVPLVLIAMLAEVLRSTIFKPNTGRLVISLTLALLSSAAVFVQATELVPQSWPRRINLSNADHDQITVLAAKYRSNSKPEALILIPPTFQHFRRYSERSVVVDFKGMPFTDAGMIEWKRRMEIVLGTAVTTESYQFENIHRLYSSQSPQQLLKIARQFHATHIMTHLEIQNTPLSVWDDACLYYEKHPEYKDIPPEIFLPEFARQFHAKHPEYQNAPLGKVIAQERNWVIWEVPPATTESSSETKL